MFLEPQNGVMTLDEDSRIAKAGGQDPMFLQPENGAMTLNEDNRIAQAGGQDPMFIEPQHGAMKLDSVERMPDPYDTSEPDSGYGSNPINGHHSIEKDSQEVAEASAPIDKTGQTDIPFDGVTSLRARPGKTSKDSKPHNADNDRGRRGDHGESPAGEEGSNPANGEQSGMGKSTPENGSAMSMPTDEETESE